MYIFVPLDMVHQHVEAERLATPINFAEESNKDIETEAVTQLLDTLYAARKPCFLVDALVARYKVSDLTRKLIDKCQLPVFCTPMGKGIVDENELYFHGIYNGQVSDPDVLGFVERDSDLIIELGSILSDSNTGGHSRAISGHKMISISPSEVLVCGKAYMDILMHSGKSATRLCSTISNCISPDQIDHGT